MEGQTFAIILGASNWPKDPGLKGSNAFLNSALAFESYISSADGLSVPRQNILNLFDSDEPTSVINEAISEFLRKIKSPEPYNLILFYTGHGGFTRAGDNYCLALRSSKRETIGASGYRVSDFAETVNRLSPTARRFVFLDACYAASAVTDFMPQSGVADEIFRQFERVLPDYGTALLCAASSDERAWAPAGAEFTMFCEALLHVLENGSPYLPQYLSLRQIHRLAVTHIHNKYDDKAVLPEIHEPKQSRGSIAESPVFRNFAVPVLDPHVNQFEGKLDIEAEREKKVENSSQNNNRKLKPETTPKENFKYFQRPVRYTVLLAVLITTMSLCVAFIGIYYQKAVFVWQDESVSIASDDDARWQTARLLGTASSLDDYIRENPQGRHVAEAKSQKKIVEQNIDAANKLAADNYFWTKSKTKNSIEAVDAYLNDFPEGVHVAEADGLKKQLGEAIRAAADNAAWEKAKAIGTIEPVQEYIRDFVGGGHVDEAIALTLRLQKQIEEANRASAEETTWKAAQSANTLEAVQVFLRRYPQGKHHTEASLLSSKLRKQNEDSARAAADDAAWQIALSAKTVEAARAYLQDYQQGSHAEEATVLADELQRQSDVAKLAKLDEAAWSVAVSANSIEAVETYLGEHQEGEHVAEANELIGRLKRTIRAADDDAWQQAKKAGTRNAAQSYLQAYGQGAHVAEARMLIAMFKANVSDPGPPNTWDDPSHFALDMPWKQSSQFYYDIGWRLSAPRLWTPLNAIVPNFLESFYRRESNRSSETAVVPQSGPYRPPTASNGLLETPSAAKLQIDSEMKDNDLIMPTFGPSTVPTEEGRRVPHELSQSRESNDPKSWGTPSEWQRKAEQLILRSNNEREAIAWASALNKNTSKSMEAYLLHYPSGIHAGEALSRKKALSKNNKTLDTAKRIDKTIITKQRGGVDSLGCPAGQYQPSKAYPRCGALQKF